MMKNALAALLVLIVFGGYALANMILVPATSAPPATSCSALITGSGADGNAILTGTATALGSLTCQ